MAEGIQELKQQEPILFYSHLDSKHGCFSNFSDHPVELKGKIYKTTEHYFQSQKFPNTIHEEQIRNAKTPNRAAAMGRNKNKPLRSDWELVKDGVMFEAVLAKFSQHEDLCRILLNTGNKILIEHTAKDSYWGDGGNGSGKNMLGKTLCLVREELKKHRKFNSEVEIPLEINIPQSNKKQQIKLQKELSRPAAFTPSRGKRKKNVFLDEQGKPLFERNDSGGVTVFGGSRNQDVNISETALTTSAKYVLKDWQAKRKYYEVNDLDTSSEDEDYDEEQLDYLAGAPLPANGELNFSYENLEQKVEILDQDLDMVVQGTTSILELMETLPENDPLLNQCNQQLQDYKNLLLNFVETEELDETVMLNVLNLLDKSNSIQNKYVE